MQEVLELSRELSHWSPATGHTYMPSIYESSKPTGPGSASRAGSIVPGGLEIDASQGSTAQPTENQTTEFSDDFFLQSLWLTSKYGQEYMDENPLQGEPGAFVFASTKEQVEARNKAQAAAQALLGAPPKANEGEGAVGSVAPTPKPAAPAIPDPASRKGSVASLPKIKEKRRKSS